MRAAVLAPDDAGKLSARELELEFAQPAAQGVFGEEELDGLPEPVRRYFRAAIAPGTPLAVSARLGMRGSIKLGGRWLPFRARQILAPHRGFVWAARIAGGLFAGSDQYIDGRGWMDWRILGMIPFVGADGPDVSRSAAARAGAEAIWVPTALLPRFGVTWTAVDETHLVARHRVDNLGLTFQCTLDDRAGVRSVHFDRWGDPNNTGAWDRYPFGLDKTSSATFGGITIPQQGRVGWFHGTERWPVGEFFRFTITDLQLVAGTD
jgi:hypothetical protein